MKNRGKRIANLLYLIFILFCLVCTTSVFSQSRENTLSYNLGNKSNQVLNLNFESALRIGVANSFDLRAIRARKNIFSFSVTESIRDYFPSLTLSYSETEEMRRRESDDRMSRLSLNSEILIYDGGKRRLNHRSVVLNGLLAGNDYRIALNKFVVSVRQQYLKLIQILETEKIYRKTYERGLLQFEFIKKEYELGDVTKLSVMEIETRVKELELSINQLIDEYESSINNFKLTLGINWKREIRISGSIGEEFRPVPIVSINREELISIGLKRRKEMESSIVQYDISKNKHQINSNYYIPNFSMGVNYTLTDNDFPPRKKGWGLNLKVTSQLFGSTVSGSSGYHESDNQNSRAFSRDASVDILNDITYRRGILESKIEMAKAREEKKYVEQSIAFDVMTACSSMINAGEMISISEKRLILYDAQLEIERMKANVGEVRRCDLLEKEIERGEVAIELLNSKIGYISSLSALETAIGVDVGFMQNYRGVNDKR